MRRRPAQLLTLIALALPPGAAAQRPVLEVADRSLPDVAVAVSDGARPIIYYNPVLMGRLGPELSAFFFAHEHGHIAARHHRPAWFERQGLTPEQTEAALRAQELEADCAAARQLADTRRESVLAALEFFRLQGARSFDGRHPTGSERAARIRACLPEVDGAPTGEPLAAIHRGWGGM